MHLMIVLARLLTVLFPSAPQTPKVDQIVSSDVSVLTSGFRLERQLKGGETHVYTVALHAGQLLSGIVEQRGVDVIIVIKDPSGKQIAAIDSPNGTLGPEPIRLVSGTSGIFRVEVGALDKKAMVGKYEVRILELLSEAEYSERQAVDTYKSPRMFQLWKQIRSRGSAAAEAFWSEMKGKTPLVEPIPGNTTESFVTWLWRGDKDTRLVSVFGGPPAEGYFKFLTQIANTDIWFLTMRSPNVARFEYAFIVNGPLSSSEDREEEQRTFVTHPPTADPLNPKAFEGISLAELPSAPPQPLIVRTTGVPCGELKEFIIESTILKEKRKLGIYTPPGYAPEGPLCSVLVVFDGEDYGLRPDALIPTPVILDNLIAKGKIPPTVAILVDSQGTRDRDLAWSKPFADFIATELVPWVRKSYHVRQNANSTVVAGSSLGGLCSFFCGFTHPEVFGNVLSQSCSAWFQKDWKSRKNQFLTADSGVPIVEYAKRRRLPLHIYMEVGQFETATMVEPNRHLRDVLRLKGYDVTYAEFVGGHDAACWRGTLGDGLITLLGKAARR